MPTHRNHTAVILAVDLHLKRQNQVITSTAGRTSVNASLRPAFNTVPSAISLSPVFAAERKEMFISVPYPKGVSVTVGSIKSEAERKLETRSDLHFNDLMMDLCY